MTTREELASTYDDLPYGGIAFRETHPGRLAAIARLLGLSPPPVETCRVLELGCAEGGNLLAMADSLPGAQLVGIDLSGRQIATGNARAKAEGMGNVELLHMDLMEVDDSLGTFDYIVAHGIYSWVPPEVADRILHLFARHLTPHGIAYVSYNVYPGWHQRRMVRDMLKWHGRSTHAPEVQVARARATLELMIRTARDQTDTYKKILQEEQKWTEDLTDGHFFHEVLEPDNHPCWFHEFLGRIARHGLQYVGESGLLSMPLGRFRPELDEMLAQFSTDPLEKEQYVDFIRARRFRKALLCREGLAVSREPDPAALDDLWLLARGRLEEAPDLSPGVETTLKTPDGRSLTTSDALLKTALAILFQEWPRAAGLDALYDAAREALGAAGAPATFADKARLRDGILKALAAEVLEAVTWMTPFVRVPGERPKAPGSVRIQARVGLPVTNLWHVPVDVEDIGRIVLSQLDGSRDRAKLLDDLVVEVVKKEFLEGPGGTPVKDPQLVRRILTPGLDAILGRLADNAFLVA